MYVLYYLYYYLLIIISFFKNYMENKNKNVWIWVVIIVIVAIVLVFWAMSGGSAPAPAYAPVAQNNNSATIPPVDSTEDLSVGSVNAGAPAATIAYADALVKYKNARLQLDETCQASPDKMSFKNNALLMVDNRAPVARTVHIGSVFPIKAYGFKIVKLSSTTLPATWLVDCDTSQNVSSILIEK
jgi:hypothetical protein